MEYRPKALDLFCGAGGASVGLHRAGFDVTGVDIKPQPRYPFPFIQADALTFPLEGFDFIWASPPCQRYSVCTAQHRHKHPDLIAVVREGLIEAGKPYVIENVGGARFHLRSPVMLCGSMFGLGVWRHRYFECSLLRFALLPSCNHSKLPVLVSGSPRRKQPDGSIDRTEPSTQERRDAMGIEWMVRTELDEAIPPAYSEFLGRQLLENIQRAAA